MQADDKVLIGRVGEHAGPQGHRRSVALREEAGGKGAQGVLVVAIRRLVDQRLWLARLAPVVVPAELEAWHFEHRKAVEIFVALVEDKDGEAVGCEQLGKGRLQPGQHLPLRHRQPGQPRQGAAAPRAGGDHQAAGLVDGAVGGDAHAIAGRLPTQHRLARVDLAAVLEGTIDERHDRALRQQEAGVWLEDGVVIGRQLIRGIAGVDLLAAEHHVRQVVFPAGTQRSLKDMATGRADVQPAGLVEQLLARFGLDLAPQFVGATQQRYVGRMLEVGHADDTRVAVRRAAAVGNVELLQPQHALAAPGKLVTGRAPHPADADNDGIVGGGCHGSVIVR